MPSKWASWVTESASCGVYLLGGMISPRIQGAGKRLGGGLGVNFILTDEGCIRVEP